MAKCEAGLPYNKNKESTKIVALVKEHGKDIDKIMEALGGEKTHD